MFTTIVLFKVLGPVHVDELGFILSHEHLSLDFDAFYVQPPKILEQFVDNEINLQNVGVVKQYPYVYILAF
jgi:predicted metal-dependent phosphotriesterase family hydrolase